MTRFRFEMRWWLALVFVGIAALTALLVATVSSRQADQSVRANAQAIAVGDSVSAGFAVERAIGAGDLAGAIGGIGGARGISLFVFSAKGTLLTPAVSHGIRWSSVPDGQIGSRCGTRGPQICSDICTHGCNGCRATAATDEGWASARRVCGTSCALRYVVGDLPSRRDPGGPLVRVDRRRRRLACGDAHLEASASHWRGRARDRAGGFRDRASAGLPGRGGVARSDD